MNKIKISNHQLFALVANFTIGTIIITISAHVAELANQDAWISALITPIIGFPFIWMYYYLGKLYSGKTLVEILISVFGKWFGWIVSACFVIFVCFLNVASVLSYVGYFMKTEYMTETPSYAFYTLIAVVLMIGLLYGLETIARSAEVFIYIVTAVIILAMLLSIPNIKVENLLPVLEKGVTPVLKGSLYLSSYLTWPIIILNMIYPANVQDISKARKPLFLGYIWGAAINFICTIMTIMVLGGTITARADYPTYLVAKEINIGIITRIEGIVSGAWIITEFIRAILYFYAGLIGFSQLFGLKDYKRIVLPLGLIVLVFAGVIYPDIAYQGKWDTTTWIPFIGTFGAVLPIVLLITAKLKTLFAQSLSVK